MKILKEGKRKWPMKVKCKCGAELEIEQTDIITFCHNGYDYLGDANGPEYDGIECPCCEKYIEVKP